MSARTVPMTATPAIGSGASPRELAAVVETFVRQEWPVTFRSGTIANVVERRLAEGVALSEAVIDSIDAFRSSHEDRSGVVSSWLLPDRFARELSWHLARCGVAQDDAAVQRMAKGLRSLTERYRAEDDLFLWYMRRSPLPHHGERELHTKQRLFWDRYAELLEGNLTPRQAFVALAGSELLRDATPIEPHLLRDALALVPPSERAGFLDDMLAAMGKSRVFVMREFLAHGHGLGAGGRALAAYDGAVASGTSVGQALAMALRASAPQGLRDDDDPVARELHSCTFISAEEARELDAALRETRSVAWANSVLHASMSELEPYWGRIPDREALAHGFTRRIRSGEPALSAVGTLIRELPGHLPLGARRRHSLATTIFDLARSGAPGTALWGDTGADQVRGALVDRFGRLAAHELVWSVVKDSRTAGPLSARVAFFAAARRGATVGEALEAAVRARPPLDLSNLSYYWGEEEFLHAAVSLGLLSRAEAERLR